MTEADFQTKFNLWAKYNITQTSAFELKLEKGKSMPFSNVQDHQMLALKLAKHGKLVHKIADVGVLQKPFDCFILMGVPAYFVIMFWTPREKNFYMIDVDVFENESRNSERRSLTPQRAEEIGILCHLN